MLFFRKMMASNIGRHSIPDVNDVQTSSNIYNDDDNIHSGSIIMPYLGHNSMKLHGFCLAYHIQIWDSLYYLRNKWNFFFSAPFCEEILPDFLPKMLRRRMLVQIMIDTIATKLPKIGQICHNFAEFVLTLPNLS